MKAARWDSSGGSVRIEVSWLTRALIPWHRADEQSGLLIRSIIDHLRSRTPQLLLTVPAAMDEAE